MRKLMVGFFVMLLLITACSPKPAPEPDTPEPPPGQVDDPGNNQGNNGPVNGNDTPKPPANTFTYSQGPQLEDTIKADYVIPVPMSISEYGMTGWALDALPSYGRPLVYKDFLIFFDAPQITAVAMGSGEVRWVREFGNGWEFYVDWYAESWISMPEGNTLAYRIVEKEHSYDEHGYMEEICLDTGEVLWTGRDPSACYLQESHYFYTGSSLARYDNLTGEMIWETPISEISLQYPYLNRTAWRIDGVVYLNLWSNDGYWAYALNHANGELMWSFDGWIKDVLGNRVLVYESTNYVCILKDAKTGEEVKKMPEASAFVWNGQLFMTNEGGLQKIDPKTGSVLWRNEKLPSASPFTDFEPPVLWVFPEVPNEMNTIFCAVDTGDGKIIESYVMDPSMVEYDIYIPVGKDTQQNTYFFFWGQEHYLQILNAKTGKRTLDLNCGPAYLSRSKGSNYLVERVYDNDWKLQELVYLNLHTGEPEFSVPDTELSIDLLIGNSLLLSDWNTSRIMFLTPPGMQ